MVAQFVAFDKLDDLPHVVVDSGPTASTELVLSHWPGVDTPVSLKADLSAGIVMNYLKSDYPQLNLSVVSTSHFDMDGLVSVYAMINPEQVMQDWHLWLNLASAGDFRHSQLADARKLVAVCEAWATPDRSPLGEKAFQQPIDRITEMLFQDLLPQLDDICRNLQTHKVFWEESETAYANTWKMVNDGLITVENDNDHELSIIRLSDSLIEQLSHQHQMQYFGLNAYVIHEIAQHFTVFLCLGSHYQIVQRYETWVQYCSRPIYLRRDFAALVELLNEMEGNKWHYDGVWKLAPMMCLTSPQGSQLDYLRLFSLVCSFIKLAPVAWNPYCPSVNNNVRAKY